MAPTLDDNDDIVVIHHWHKMAPPHCVGRNRTARARFWNLALTYPPPPLAQCLIPLHHHLKPGEPHPNKVSCT